MGEEQTELGLRVRKAAGAVRVSEEEVELLDGCLKGSEGWVTAAEIAVAVGLNERRVRAAAAFMMPAVVSWPGSPGYKHWEHCTVDEIDHCIEAFESQAKDMFKRAQLYRLAYHARFRGGWDKGRKG